MYVWKKNNVIVGTNSTTYTDTIFATGDSVWAEVTSNASCLVAATVPSNKIVITVTNKVTPTGTIVASAATICKGVPVTFTATATNAGTYPVYLWQKNGVRVGNTSPTYVDSTLNSGDSVWVVVNANYNCLLTSSAISNKLSINVNPYLTPSLSISASATSLCSGVSVVLTANPTNSGTLPTFQWKKAGVNIAGAVGLSYTYLPSNGDSISCVMVASNACQTTATAISNGIKLGVLSAITKPVSYASCSSVVYKAKTYTSSTIVTDTVKSFQGCDSIYNVATITIAPNSPTTITTSLSSCNSVVYNNITYTSSTIKRDTTKSVGGCDSIYKVTTITITPIVAVTKPVYYASCSNVVYKTKTYTSSSIVRDTLKSVQGCDSIYNVATITITPITPTTITSSLTGCNSVVYNGVTYTSSTIKRDTTKSVGGCDSLYKVATITITPIVAVTKPVSYASCSSVVYKAKTYTSSTVVRDTLKSVQGCDSIYNVATITITPITPTTITSSLSGCNSVAYNNITYTSSTIKRDTTKSVGGCDSIYKVTTITITPIVAVTKPVYYASCSNVVYKTKTYTSSSIVRDTLKSVQGCDSIYNVATITITPITPTTITSSLTGCNSVVYNGVTYTSSTIKRDTTKSVGGCDSLYKVATITITPIVAVTKPVSYASCSSVVYKAKTYTSSTVVRDTLKSVQGCDSIYNVATITITPITPTTITSSLSGCNSVAYNNITYTSSTIKRDTTKSVGGCDSIYKVTTITVNIPIAPIITSVGNNPICLTTGDSLIMSTTSSSAQWFRNNVSIPKSTGSRYVAHLYGTYNVYAPDVNGCYATSTPVALREQFVPAPLISRIGNVLTSSFTGSNQWYQNSVIPVASTTSYVMDTTVYGVYSVQANVNGCKSPMSNYIVNTRDSINSVNENCPTVTTPSLFSENTQKAETSSVTLTYEGADLNVKLFPNPSGSNAFVQITGATSKTDITVTDMLGRTIWRNSVGGNKTISLPAGTLAQGVYMVSVTNEGQRREIKWVINR